MIDPKERMLASLQALYGDSSAAAVFERLTRLLDDYRRRLPAPRSDALTQQDAYLIVYPDQVSHPGRRPLKVLHDFCGRYLDGIINSIHLLPFYPYSSDDGFSVIDYRAVGPGLGTWRDVDRFARTFRLMFDGVVNHISKESAWFQAFLKDDPSFRDFFITVEGNPDLTQVVRPRVLPLLTPFRTARGDRQVWTTFSADQVDLNYHSPDVLLEIVDTLLFYVSQGAGAIRLDAIAYLWKEIGTSCIHLPQTHRLIQLFRSVLDEVAPQVDLITETNVAHAENISYFGDGHNEAQLVYNFALPPLVLHSFRSGNATALSGWADRLGLPSGEVTFFNFLASHDGIGLNAARGILSTAEIDALVERTLSHGGFVSYSRSADGSQMPYELNISYFDALSDPNDGAEAVSMQADRFIAAQAILLALAGVPGIYFHSLFGSRGWRAGALQTGVHRTINRQKLDLEALERELGDPATLRAQVFRRYEELLRARAASPAFHPQGAQQVLHLHESVFALLRAAPDDAETVLCLHNVAAERLMLQLPSNLTPDLSLLDGREMRATQVELEPYQVLWLKVREAG